MVRKMSFSVFVNSFEFGVAVGVFIVVYFIMLWLDSRYKFPEPEYLEDVSGLLSVYTLLLCYSSYFDCFR